MPSHRALSAVLAAVASFSLAACDQSTGIAGPRPNAANDVAAARQSAEYTVVDLGTLGGATSVANDVNEHGQVVGSSLTAAGETHAFIWTRQRGMTDLGALAPGRPSSALDVNNAGVIVGVADNAAGDAHAVVWTADGQIRDLGAPDGFISRAESINERGIIVGIARSKAVPMNTRALRWLPDGTMEDLGTLGHRNARLADINAGGAVVASVDVGPFFTHALLIRGDRPPIDIGNLGGAGEQDGAIANAISNRGEVTGLSVTPDGVLHAFLWTPTEGIRDLGLVDGETFGLSEGRSINSSGAVVGISQTFGTPGRRAFVWTSQGGMRALESLGGLRSEANGINERGQIVGFSQLASTPATHATLWQPAARP